MSKQDKKELRQQIACEWLEENYLNYGSLRHDIVTDRLQIRVADLHSLEDASLRAPQKSVDFSGTPLQAKGERQETWRNLTDKDINTMVCQCVMETAVNISVTEMWTALKSDMVPAVHPLREWLDGLRPWNSCEPDWIDWVAQQVRVRESSVDRPKGLSERTACCQTTMLLDRPYGAERPTNLTGEAGLIVSEAHGLTSNSSQSE